MTSRYIQTDPRYTVSMASSSSGDRRWMSASHKGGRSDPGRGEREVVSILLKSIPRNWQLLNGSLRHCGCTAVAVLVQRPNGGAA